MPLLGFWYAQAKLTTLLTLPNAGTQSAELSALRTALMATVWVASATWFATLKRKPASAALKVHAGAPKLHVVALAAAGARPLKPSTTLPSEVSWSCRVVDAAPLARLNAAPPTQFAVGPEPAPAALAVSVALSPPLKVVVQAAFAHATTLSVAGLQVRPMPVPWRISTWCGPVCGGGGSGEPSALVAHALVQGEPQHTLGTIEPAPREIAPVLLLTVPPTTTPAPTVTAP